MGEFTNAESVRLVAVKPALKGYELRNENIVPSRLRNDKNMGTNSKCVLMTALLGNDDEVKRIGESKEGAIDIKDEFGSSALHYAARHNNARVIRMLLSAGADINLKGPAGQTPLYTTARFNCVDAAKVLLDNKADATIRSDDNSVPLHAASRNGYLDIVRLLLNSNSSVVNAKSTGCVTPLAFACMNKDKSVVELLAENKADITAVDVENKTPLHTASGSGNTEVVKFLIQTASNRFIDVKDYLNAIDYEGNTALHVSCIAGHEHIVEELLLNGADPLTKRKGTKDSAIHAAAIGGNTVVIEHLLSYGASLEALDSEYRTPLHKAASVGKISAIKFLLDKGAKIDAKDISGMTPFLLAIKQGKKQAAAALLERGANWKASDINFRTAFHYAVKYKAVDALEMLIEKDDGTLLEMKDAGLQTPLHHAASTGDIKIISMLLQKDSQLQARDIDEETPLHIAASAGFVNATDLLARMSPKTINARDIYGRTPLHCAVRGGFRKTCAVLLDLCANVAMRDLNRRTALHVAAEYGKVNCVKTLLADRDSHLLEMLDEDENSALHLACSNDEVNIVKILLDADADVTVRNKEGKTCLDLAIDWELSDVAKALVQHKRWCEIMRIPGPDGHQPMKRLIEVLPKVAEIALNQCLEISKLPSTHPDYYIEFNLVLLDPGPDDESSLRGDPFHGPTIMVKYNREDLLNHPVTQALLRYKWFAYGKILYYINTALYFLFTILFSYFIVTERGRISLFFPWSVNASSEEEKLLNEQPNSTTSFASFITFLLCVQFLKEIYQMFILKYSYLKEFTNIIELTLYSSASIYIMPYLAAMPLYYSPSVQWNAGVVALIMCHSNLLLYIRRVGQGGIYVSMYIEVLFTFLRVLSVFVVAIFGSTLIFYVLLKEEDNFSNVLVSFVKTSVMMVGELDYTDMLSDNVVNRNINPKTGAPFVPFPVVTYICFFFFMMLVPVLLMNLLVGLAVGDIDAIQKSASFSRLKDQAKFVEDSQKRYPLRLMRLLYKDKLIIKPNVNKLFKSLLMAGTSVIDTDYLEELTNLKSTYTNDATKNDEEKLRWQKQKLKHRALEAKIDQQNKLLVAIAQKLGIAEMDIVL